MVASLGSGRRRPWRAGSERRCGSRREAAWGARDMGGGGHSELDPPHKRPRRCHGAGGRISRVGGQVGWGREGMRRTDGAASVWRG